MTYLDETKFKVGDMVRLTGFAPAGFRGSEADTMVVLSTEMVRPHQYTVATSDGEMFYAYGCEIELAAPKEPVGEDGLALSLDELDLLQAGLWWHIDQVNTDPAPAFALLDRIKSEIDRRTPKKGD